jgi:hypothetical protein
MAYSDGIFNPYTFVMQPNTIIPVMPSPAGNWPIAPFPDNSPPQFVQITALDLKAQINKLMYADPLGPVDAPPKTATEIAIRQRNLAEQIGPPFARIQKEYLPRIIDRALYILTKKGKIEPFVVDGKAVQIQYQSPMTIAQGQIDVDSFVQWFTLVQGIYGEERAQAFINPVEVPYWLADKMGVDPTLIIEKEALGNALGNQGEMEQQMQIAQLEQAQGMVQGRAA